MIEKSVEGFLRNLFVISYSRRWERAALMGSMGAALVSMVANLTTEKKYEAVEKEVLDSLNSLKSLESSF